MTELAPFGERLPEENPGGLGVFEYNLRAPGQMYDIESGLHYNYFRDYDPQISRYVQSDPIGLAGGINSYGYVNQQPLNLVDPLGLFDMPTFSQGVIDFSAGMGDIILFGQGQWLRDIADISGGIDHCSSEYSAGEWVGIAASAATGVAGGIKAAGAKGAGMEFSHWLPSRFFKISSPSFKSGLANVFGQFERTIFNGNYVTPTRHYLHDSFRFPKGWRDLGPRLSPFMQQWDRIPNLFKGTAAGTAYGTVAATTNDCECRK